MTKFIRFIGTIIVLLLLIAIALDGIYTCVFTHSLGRNKIEQVMNGQPQQFDVVILGTSRANNHFVPELFEEKGYTAFNYGMSGSHLLETALMLKLMLHKGWKIKNIVLEADLNLTNEKRDEGTFAWFMPFLHQSDIIKEHIKSEADYIPLYYVPFYRYNKFDARIGFRAWYKTLMNEPTSILQNKGYYPLGVNPRAKMSNDIRSLNPLKNRFYEEIKKLCKAHQINLIAVTTPMCSDVKGMNYFQKVKQAYPEILPYEHVIDEDRYFSSCGHLNDAGARKFTSILLKTLPLKK